MLLAAVTGLPWMLSPRGPAGWGCTTGTFCWPWPFPSSPPKGRRVVRVALEAVLLKIVPGLVYLPVAQHRRVPPSRAALLGNAGDSPVTF